MTNRNDYDWRSLEEMQADTLNKIRLANLPPDQHAQVRAEKTASLLDELKKADDFAAQERLAAVGRYYSNRRSEK